MYKFHISYFVFFVILVIFGFLYFVYFYILYILYTYLFIPFCILIWRVFRRDGSSRDSQGMAKRRKFQRVLESSEGTEVAGSSRELSGEFPGKLRGHRRDFVAPHERHQATWSTCFISYVCFLSSVVIYIYIIVFIGFYIIHYFMYMYIDEYE